MDQNGWWKCGDKGVIFQWGYTEKTLAESSETITFSTEFPHACFGGMASPSYPSTLASNSSAYFFNLNDGKRAIITCDQSAGA
ncbi:gp53-like domain-containing protein, partial [Xenorhabdus bovienii]|uniref:gp53-like domain-containing protein n=1 Tax=Xenorhabdus bovienii TaxID=40576 RepID=UPI003F68579C